MPQLNPTPWFLIFVLAWIAIIMMFTKTLSSTPHLSTPQHNKQLNNYYWTWPWP